MSLPIAPRAPAETPRSGLPEAEAEHDEVHWASLSVTPPLELLRDLADAAKTVRVLLQRGATEGELLLERGRVRSAYLGSLQGEEAVFRWATWTAGDYLVDELEALEEADRGPEASWVESGREELLAEVELRLRDWKERATRLPSLDAVLQLGRPAGEPEGSAVPASVAFVAALFDGRRTLRDVLDASPREDRSTLRALGTLVQLGWLPPPSSEAQPPPSVSASPTPDSASSDPAPPASPVSDASDFGTTLLVWLGLRSAQPTLPGEAGPAPQSPVDQTGPADVTGAAPAATAARDAGDSDRASSPRAPLWQGVTLEARRSLALGAALAGLLVFGSSLGFALLQGEDFLAPLSVASGASGGGGDRSALRAALQGAAELRFRPLAWLSHELDVFLFGASAWGHHLSSLLLHASSVALLVAFVGRLTRRWPAALCAGLLFAVHPQRSASVAWVGQRHALLALVFGLGALLAHLDWARRGRPRSYLLGLGLYLGSLLSDGSFLFLPLVLFLLDGWLLDRRPRATLAELAWEKLPYLGASASFVGVQILAKVQELASTGGATGAVVSSVFSERYASASVSVWQQLGKFLLPWSPSLHYGWTTPSFSWAWGSFGGLVLLLGWAWSWRDKAPALGVGLAWFVLGLLPSLGLFEPQTFSSSDAAVGPAQVGLLLALIGGLSPVLRSKISESAQAKLALAAALVFALRSAVELPRWKSAPALWLQAWVLEPENVVARERVRAFVEAGAYEGTAAPSLDVEAKQALKRLKSSAASPAPPAASASSGSTGSLGSLGSTGRPPTSPPPSLEQAAKAALEGGGLQPPDGPPPQDPAAAQAPPEGAPPSGPELAAQLNMEGVNLAQSGKIAEARDLFKRALEVNPADFGARYNVGRAERELGNAALGMEFWVEALRQSPRNEHFCQSMREALQAPGPEPVYEQAKALVAESCP